jgi:hypothetical protein
MCAFVSSVLYTLFIKSVVLLYKPPIYACRAKLAKFSLSYFCDISLSLGFKVVPLSYILVHALSAVLQISQYYFNKLNGDFMDILYVNIGHFESS